MSAARFTTPSWPKSSTACERSGPNLPVAEHLAPELDDDGLPWRQRRARASEFDDVDDLGAQPLRERGRLVRRPFELLVELAGRHQDRELGQPSVEGGLEPEILVHRANPLSQLGAVQPDPARPTQADQRTAAGIDHGVVELLAPLVHGLAAAQGQPG